jgi:hypothetical protein
MAKVEGGPMPNDFIEKIGDVYVSCDGDVCLVMIKFFDGTIYVTGEFRRDQRDKDHPEKKFKEYLLSKSLKDLPLKS